MNGINSPKEKTSASKMASKPVIKLSNNVINGHYQFSIIPFKYLPLVFNTRNLVTVKGYVGGLGEGGSIVNIVFFVKL